MIRGQTETQDNNTVFVLSGGKWVMVKVAETQDNYLVVVDGKNKVFVVNKEDARAVDLPSARQLSFWGGE